MRKEKTVYVFADWLGDRPVLVGCLHIDVNRNKEIFSFEYDSEWIKKLDKSNKPLLSLDPDLQLTVGRQYLTTDKPIFGCFSDSCPDRWGRLLMKRREAILADQDQRKPRTLHESDFLLGVYDEARMGGLRFSLSKDGIFLASDEALATPPWVSLRDLEEACRNFERSKDPFEQKWLSQLLAPGSSLGGARPKATVKDTNGSLWIAKFPSKDDDWDTGAWEMVTHELAKTCGLEVPDAKLQVFSKYGSTFLCKRFDRENGKRIHFSSAMTLLGEADNHKNSDTGYLDIVDFITSNGAQPKEDLKELWKRIVFSMAVSNTDDHLRNHGFLLTANGWKLSPMFDVNPNIYGDNLSLTVDGVDSAINYDLALESAVYFGLEKEEARKLLGIIRETVESNWETYATRQGISHSEITRMSPAFDPSYK